MSNLEQNHLSQGSSRKMTLYSCTFVYLLCSTRELLNWQNSFLINFWMKPLLVHAEEGDCVNVNVTHLIETWLRTPTQPCKYVRPYDVWSICIVLLCDWNMWRLETRCYNWTERNLTYFSSVWVVHIYLIFIALMDNLVNERLLPTSTSNKSFPSLFTLALSTEVHELSLALFILSNVMLSV